MSDRYEKYGRKYYNNNKEKCRQYYLANKEKIKLYYKIYVRKNPEKNRSYQEKYRNNNKSLLKNKSKMNYHSTKLNKNDQLILKEILLDNFIQDVKEIDKNE